MRMNKKGQLAVLAFWKVGVMIAIFVPFMLIFGNIRDYVFSTTTNIWIRLIVSVIPMAYALSIVYAFVNTMRGLNVQNG